MSVSVVESDDRDYQVIEIPLNMTESVHILAIRTELVEYLSYIHVFTERII